MKANLLLAASLTLLGACASVPPTSALEITPVERLSGGVTPERADTLLARGYHEQAAAAYRAALVVNPTDRAAQYGLAESQRRSGKFADSTAGFEALAQVPEYRVRALESLGRIALASGDLSGAWEKFSIAAAEDATAWRSWLAIAQMQDLASNWSDADAAYVSALAASDEPAVVYNNHGVSLLARGNIPGALEMFRKAIAADSRLVHAATNLDLAEAKAGQSAGSPPAGGDARDRARKLNNQGYVAMLQGRTTEAKELYEAALREHPAFYAVAYGNLQSMKHAQDAQ